MSRIDWRNRRRYIGAGVIASVVVTPVVDTLHTEQPLPSWKVEQRHITPDADGTTLKTEQPLPSWKIEQRHLTPAEGRAELIHRYQPLPSWKIEERHMKPKRRSPGGFGEPGKPFEITGLESDEDIIMLLTAFLEVMNRNR